MRVLASTLTLLPFLGGCERADGDQDPSCDVSPGMGEPSEFLDLHVHFEGQSTVASKTISIITHELTDSTRVYAASQLTIDASGSFDVTWPDAYRRFEYQPISFYVDLDGDGHCGPGIDAGKRHISTAWNPVGDAMLDEDLGLVPLEPVAHQVCADIERCLP